MIFEGWTHRCSMEQEHIMTQDFPSWEFSSRTNTSCHHPYQSFSIVWNFSPLRRANQADMLYEPFGSTESTQHAFRFTQTVNRTRGSCCSVCYASFIFTCLPLTVPSSMNFQSRVLVQWMNSMWEEGLLLFFHQFFEHDVWYYMFAFHSKGLSRTPFTPTSSAWSVSKEWIPKNEFRIHT